MVTFVNGEESSTILENLTIINGATNGDGGGINCMYASPTPLRNLIIQNNSSNSDGGGISCYRWCQVYVVENVKILNNIAGWGV